MYILEKGLYMNKILLLLLLWVASVSAGDSTWCVMLGKVYHSNDSLLNQRLQRIQKDSLVFIDKHFCKDIASRQYFRLFDSLMPGVYRGEPDAFYSRDSLPSSDFQLWLSVGDSTIASLLGERYLARPVRDIEGKGPGLKGEWNVLLPQLFHERVEAVNFFKELKEEFGISSIGYALITAGEYLFFGSCLSRSEALVIETLLMQYGLPVYVCRVKYQHIDL